MDEQAVGGRMLIVVSKCKLKLTGNDALGRLRQGSKNDGSCEQANRGRAWTSARPSPPAKSCSKHPIQSTQ